MLLQWNHILSTARRCAIYYISVGLVCSVALTSQADAQSDPIIGQVIQDSGWVVRMGSWGYYDDIAAYYVLPDDTGLVNGLAAQLAGQVANLAQTVLTSEGQPAFTVHGSLVQFSSLAKYEVTASIINPRYTINQIPVSLMHKIFRLVIRAATYRALYSDVFFIVNDWHNEPLAAFAVSGSDEQ